MHRQYDFVLLAIWATATASLAQTAISAEGPASTGVQGAISTPDFSGVWTKPYLGWELPLSGPGPVTNKVRRRQNFDIDGRPWPAATAPLVNTAAQLIGDDSNPILKPAAAQEVKRRGENELHGTPNATARNQCWPEGVPAVFRDMTIQMLQQPDKITILYDYDHEVRRVRMNQQHPVQVAPTWYGDSVGHYEGDTLVIDTVGIKIGPFTMADNLGTPQSPAMHIVERYFLIDGAQAKARMDAWEAHEGTVGGGGRVAGYSPDTSLKGLQLEVTMDDPKVFVMPLTARITYRRVISTWQESVCAENPTDHYPGEWIGLPRAEHPDF